MSSKVGKPCGDHDEPPDDRAVDRTATQRGLSGVPGIYGRALRLPSSVVLFALLAGGTLMGILGALLALPVAATVMMLIEELRVELPGGLGHRHPSETRAVVWFV